MVFQLNVPPNPESICFHNFIIALKSTLFHPQLIPTGNASNVNRPAISRSRSSTPGKRRALSINVDVRDFSSQLKRPPLEQATGLSRARRAIRGPVGDDEGAFCHVECLARAGASNRPIWNSGNCCATPTRWASTPKNSTPTATTSATRRRP